MVKLLKSYKDIDFLNSPDARQIRILCELTAPKASFEKNQIENTIVFFGSARSISQEDADQQLTELKKEFKDQSLNQEQQSRLKKAEILVRLAQYYEEARVLAKKLTKWSLSIDSLKDRFYICSGGGPGMMEASNRGASEAGGESIGFNISLPFEQDANPYQTEKYSHEFHYFFIRKFWFAYLAKSLVVFPGGFGTMDELFELMTLIQTQKIEKQMPIVLYGAEFWNGFMNFETLVEWGVIGEDDLKLFKIVDDTEEAFQYLKGKLKKYYL
jgi:uncharacterized protein (TIGR00730 family)